DRRRVGRVRRQPEKGARLGAAEEPEQDEEKRPAGRAQEEQLRLRKKGDEHSADSFGADAAFRVARIKSQFLRQRNGCGSLRALLYRYVRAGWDGPAAGPGMRADHASAPETTRTSAASSDGAKKDPDRSASTPATMGPTIWPTPKEAVISAKTRRGASGASCRPFCNPSAVMAMKVPPSKAPASSGPIRPPTATLAATPTASVRQPAA